MDLLPSGDRRRSALDKIRREREALLQEIDVAGSGRLSCEETIQRLIERLREKVDRAQQAVIAFSRPDVVPDMPPADAAFLLWLDAKAFETQLRARLKPLLPASAPSLVSRPAAIAKLKARLVELEHDEEAAVLKLIDAGAIVERRGELNLAAILATWDQDDAVSGTQ